MSDLERSHGDFNQQSDPPVVGGTQSDAGKLSAEIALLQADKILRDLEIKHLSREFDERATARRIEYWKLGLGVVPLIAVAVTVIWGAIQYFDQQQTQEQVRDRQLKIALVKDLTDTASDNATKISAALQLGNYGPEVTTNLINNLATGGTKREVVNAILRALDTAASGSLADRQTTTATVVNAARQVLTGELERPQRIREWVITANTRAITTVASPLPQNDTVRKQAEALLKSVKTSLDEITDVNVKSRLQLRLGNDLKAFEQL